MMNGDLNSEAMRMTPDEVDAMNPLIQYVIFYKHEGIGSPWNVTTAFPVREEALNSLIGYSGIDKDSIRIVRVNLAV
jgi:hypothetical protein